MPAPFALPQGCRFHPRCVFSIDACTKINPPLVPVGPGVVGTDGEGHLVACIRAPLEAAVAGETIGAEVVR